MNQDDDISCYVMEGQLSIYFSDLNRISYGTQLILDRVKSMMKDGQLDHCHPAIIRVQFHYSNDDETNSNLENGVLDKSSSLEDVGNPNGMENFLNTMISSKGMVIVGASIGMIPIALFLMQRYHKKKRSHYKEKDKYLEDTESSSGGGYSRPYNFLSSLLFESDSDIDSDNSDIYSYSSSSTGRRRSLQKFLRCLPPDLEFRPEDTEFQPQQRAIQMSENDQSPTSNRKERSSNIFDSTLVVTQDNKTHRSRYSFTTLNTMRYFLCSLKLKKIFQSRYFRYIFTAVISISTIVLVKVLLGRIGMTQLGLQLIIIMMLLFGFALVVIIILYGQQPAQIERDQGNETSINEKNSPDFNDISYSIN